MGYGTTEHGLIAAVVDSPTADEPRVEYADWLRSEGDEARSSIVQATRVRSLVLVTLGTELSALRGGHVGWSRLIGAQLIQQACDLGLQRFVERWLRLARPALELVVGAPVEEAPVGASRLWGDPDLPGGTRWPTLADCKRWEPEIDLPADSPCQFLGQISLDELSSTAAADALPSTGLLSIFAHHEWETTGSSSICLKYFGSTEGLERVAHAHTDQDNARLQSRSVDLVDALTLPESYESPFSDAIGFARTDTELDQKYRQVSLASSGGILGLLGHDRATTGADPTPAADWERLINVPLEPDYGVLHLAIQHEKLHAAQVEDHEFVWVDFD